MNCVEKDGNLYVNGISDFHLGQTLECGQCFHFEKIGENEYYLSAKGRFLHVLQKEDFSLVFYDTDMGTFDKARKNYFDLERDYGLIKSEINKNISKDIHTNISYYNSLFNITSFISK